MATAQALPVGTVTFLFTDIEASTRMLRELGRERYEEVVALHNTLIRNVIGERDGIEVDRQGDGFFFVFPKATAAVRAAADMQRALCSANWPHVDNVRVRIGIHTGEAELGSEGYVGLAVHKAARLTKAGDGGQVLLSLTTVKLVEDELAREVELHDLGDWQPDGFEGRHRLYALTLDGTATTATIPSRLRFTGRPNALLERDQELAAINRLVEEPTAGRFIAIDGRPGMGKTQLVLAARDAAERNGMQVLTARGAELEHEFGYGVVRQLFEPLLVNLDPADEARLLAGPAAFAGRLFREAELAAAPEGDVGFAMLHGLYWLAVNIGARRPTLLALDDLHWADAATLRWMCYLVPRLEGVPLAVLVASRPPEMGREPALLEQLLSDPNAIVLRPGPLHNESVASMIYAAFFDEPDQSFVDTCREATGGNPLFLRALIEALKDEGSDLSAGEIGHVQRVGPQAVSRVIHLRLARLGASARAVAEAVAVLGEDADLDAAASLTSLDVRAVEEAATALALGDLIRLERPLRFSHPVVRASVYEQIVPTSRPELHRAAATLLASRRATPERIATHLLLADPAKDSFVVETLREAAARSLAHGVSDVATAYLRRALEEPPPESERASLLYDLGRAELLVEGPAAVEHLREATEVETDTVRRAECALAYGQALWLTRDHAMAIDVYRTAIASLGDEQRELRERLEAELISSAWWEAEYLPIAIDTLERIDVDDLAGGLGSDMLLANLAFIRGRQGEDREAAIEFARRALADGLLHRRGGTITFQYAALSLVMGEEFDEALEAYDVALSESRKRGDVVREAAVLMFRGFTNTRLGRLSEALDDLRQAVDLAGAARAETTYPYATAFLCEALLETGDVEGAAEALELLPVPDELPESAHYFFYVTARGTLRLAQGRREDGLRDLLSLGATVSQLHTRSTAWGRWRGRAARALLEEGDRERALELAHEELEAAQRWGAPRALGLAVMTMGLAEGGDRGEELLREAVEILEQSPAKLARARALLELGAALRRRNKRAEAREPLREALELATDCGAAKVAERAREELVATGAKPRKVAVSGAGVLTPSEWRVARMAVDGMTNREIAQSLFVTPKTVEVHLSNVYRKLGIASRTQLADALPVQ